MHLPQHIIDFVGTLLDEGWSDEEICNAAVRISGKVATGDVAQKAFRGKV